MKNLISIILIAVFGLIIVFGVLGFIGSLIGLTFGFLGAIIGLAFKIVFSPLILVVIAVFAVLWVFGRRAAK